MGEAQSDASQPVILYSRHRPSRAIAVYGADNAHQHDKIQ